MLANPAQPSPANSTNGLDLKVIGQLAESLQITIPRNMDLRSKTFLCHSKEQMLKKLFDAINQSNGVELNFKRSNFSHYKGFVGKGNNQPLIF